MAGMVVAAALPFTRRHETPREAARLAAATAARTVEAPGVAGVPDRGGAEARRAQRTSSEMACGRPRAPLTPPARRLPVAGMVVAAALPFPRRRHETPRDAARVAAVAVTLTVEAPGVAGVPDRAEEEAWPAQRTSSEIASGLTRARSSSAIRIPVRRKRRRAPASSRRSR